MVMLEKFKMLFTFFLKNSRFFYFPFVAQLCERLGLPPILVPFLSFSLMPTVVLMLIAILTPGKWRFKALEKFNVFITILWSLMFCLDILLILYDCWLTFNNPMDGPEHAGFAFVLTLVFSVFVWGPPLVMMWISYAILYAVFLRKASSKLAIPKASLAD